MFLAGRCSYADLAAVHSRRFIETVSLTAGRSHFRQVGRGNLKMEDADDDGVREPRGMEGEPRVDD